MKICPEIKQIISISTTSASIYASNKSLDDVQIAGVSARVKEVTNIPLIMGRFFTSEEVNNLAHVCVIGEKIYNEIFKNQSPVGQSLYVTIEANQKINLRVIGVLNTTNQQSYGMIGKDGIFVPITVFQKKIVAEKISILY